MTTDLWREFVSAAAGKLDTDLKQITRCARLLSESELWSRVNENCNSVGNLLLHLTGNVRQWIVAGLGGEPFERDRPAEFAQRGPLPLEPILERLQATVRAAVAIIEGLDEPRLARAYSIQKYDVSGMQAVFHVAEHFSFHTGQIVHMTKALRDVNLSLFDSQGRKLAQGENNPW